jgi:predicted nucleic acid-binding protein
MPDATEVQILEIQLLEITAGYWERAGRLRALMISKGWNVSLADTLIAQSCLDHGVALITRDKGFKCFQKVAGLQLR